jgi:flagellar basal body-associated protein FliL
MADNSKDTSKKTKDSKNFKWAMLGCGAVLFIVVGIFVLIFVVGNLNTLTNK